MRIICIALSLTALLLGSVYAGVGAGTLGIFRDQQDIGPVIRPGVALFDAGPKSYRVTCSGADRSPMTDAFHFVYSKASGDITFSADVRFLGPAKDMQSKAMLMVRQTLEPNSAYADVALLGSGFTSLEYRPSAGVATAEFRAAMKSPSQLSISRHGHEFTIYAGNPGEEPAMTGPIVVTMQDPVYVGLGVSTQTPGVADSTVFSNVRLTKGSGK